MFHLLKYVEIYSTRKYIRQGFDDLKQSLLALFQNHSPEKNSAQQIVLKNEIPKKSFLLDE